MDVPLPGLEMAEAEPVVEPDPIHLLLGQHAMELGMGSEG